MAKLDKLMDLIIIGTGCVGYGGAMYAGRMQLKTLIIGEDDGGVLKTTDVVENYPGFIRLTGQELVDKLKDHALDYKEFVEFVNDRATAVKKEKGIFVVKTKEKEYQSKAIIFATGAKHRELNVPGEKEFWSRGISTCGLCDGAFFKNKIVAVVGGSDSAAKEALLLTQWAKKVYIIYRRDKIHPEPVNGKRIEQKVKEGKIEIIYNTNITEIKGKEKISHIVFDKPYKDKKDFPVDGIFLSIGMIPQSDLAKKLGVKVNEKNEIIVDRESKTNIPGVFAAGDVVDTKFKQAITGMGEIVSAVYSAYKYINENELHSA